MHATRATTNPVNTTSVELSASQSFQALYIGRILQVEVDVRSSGWTLVSLPLATCEFVMTSSALALQRLQ